MFTYFIVMNAVRDLLAGRFRFQIFAEFLVFRSSSVPNFMPDYDYYL